MSSSRVWHRGDSPKAMSYLHSQERSKSQLQASRMSALPRVETYFMTSLQTPTTDQPILRSLQLAPATRLSSPNLFPPGCLSKNRLNQVRSDCRVCTKACSSSGSPRCGAHRHIQLFAALLLLPTSRGLQSLPVSACQVTPGNGCGETSRQHHLSRTCAS